MTTDALICWSCSRPTDITGRPARNDECPLCMAELRCCRGCRHFDPTRRYACRETVDTKVVNKEKSNFCDYFQPRLVTKKSGGIQKGTTTESKEDRRQAFDDLFDD